MARSAGQRERAKALLGERGMARLVELRAAGVTAATIGRMERDGEVLRLTRGVYQLADAPLHAQHSLAQIAKRVPKGVVCLTSALAFHGLTDQMPAKIWVAIGAKDWAPRGVHPPIRIARFAPALLEDGIETHTIDGTPVRVFDVPKTIADCFRHRRTVGLGIAIAGLQAALRQRKATPAEIARHAERGGVATVIRPYLEAFTADA